MITLEPKFLGCLARDPKDGLLAIVEAFSQFEVLEGHPSRDWP